MTAVGTLHCFILDCPDPLALAAFYRTLVGGTIEGGAEDSWVDLLQPAGAALAFQRSPGFVAPQWPSSDGDQQAHLDIRVDDLAAVHDAVIAAGAQHLETHETFRVYLDPVGHPFCTVS